MILSLPVIWDVKNFPDWGVFKITEWINISDLITPSLPNILNCHVYELVRIASAYVTFPFLCPCLYYSILVLFIHMLLQPCCFHASFRHLLGFHKGQKKMLVPSQTIFPSPLWPVCFGVSHYYPGLQNNETKMSQQSFFFFFLNSRSPCQVYSHSW